MYVKIYFVTLASSTLVGFHEGRHFKQSIYKKEKENYVQEYKLQ